MIFVPTQELCADAGHLAKQQQDDCYFASASGASYVGYSLDKNRMRPYKPASKLRKLRETADGRVEKIRKANCEACGTLLHPRSATQIVFTVRPEDKAHEDKEIFYYVCPHGCRQSDCYAAPVLRLGAQCPYCGEVNSAN